MSVQQPVFITGHRGLVGSALWRAAGDRGVSVVGRTREELDLTEKTAVAREIGAMTPGSIVLASGRVGGILANVAAPADFLDDNLQIQINVLSAAVAHRVPRLLFLGSAAMYPEHAPQPLAENSLLRGTLEPSHEAYAMAKLAGTVHVRAIRQQHGLGYITAIPTNLYGPGDQFDLSTGQVIPAMIRKMHDAKVRDERHVALWGTGDARREFLHVDDLATACLFLLEHYDDPEPINVGVGNDLTIRELAQLVRGVVGFEGSFLWDPSKPGGAQRRLLDSRKIAALGWTPTVSLEDGIRSTYALYLEHLADGRA
ncbi:MAG: GDP-L-fucose synthase family protein [Mycobacteriales bacterium]